MLYRTLLQKSEALKILPPRHKLAVVPKPCPCIEARHAQCLHRNRVCFYRPSAFTAIVPRNRCPRRANKAIESAREAQRVSRHAISVRIPGNPCPVPSSPTPPPREDREAVRRTEYLRFADRGCETNDRDSRSRPRLRFLSGPREQPGNFLGGLYWRQAAAVAVIICIL